MSMLKWIKSKYLHRRAGKEDHDPWWVTLMLDVGRPLVAVLILTMCAPGEHYLAVQAGWSQLLAWGMPGTLTAYAGIAAVVATKRPKGAPGRKTAVWGAVLSILTAMAAQPIAHLYGRHSLPTQTVALTIVAGLVPAAVFGHLLHMGATSPKPKALPQTESRGIMQTMKPSVPDTGQTIPSVLDSYLSDGGHGIPVSQWISDNMSQVSRPGLSVSETDSSPDSATWTAGQDTDSWTEPMDTDSVTHSDTPVFGQLSPDSPVRDNLTATVRPSNVRKINKPTLSADIRAYLSAHPDADDTDLAAAMSVKWPDKPWASVQRIKNRYKGSQETGS